MKKFALFTFLIIILSSCSHAVFIYTFKDVFIVFLICALLLFIVGYFLYRFIQKIKKKIKEFFGEKKK